ncbi:hypothetical protein P3X46_001158 [Hevea brasiliensis]|uniref:EF-hand domain-containing protein n=1 Tax=Hevea brasiliensis TaxID=3981 RepID=A0ABQ9NFJ8_HEVBR|nr:hypothetical protein P3X46_001158 [Hevea brasiliensis]
MRFHFTVNKDAPLVLTEEQLKKIFKQADVNNDNCLSWDEVRKVFDNLGSCIPGVRAHLGIWHADANGDGKVDLNTELDDLVNYARGLGFTITNKIAKQVTA